MEFQEVLRGRRSIRAFTDEAVPPDVVTAVLDDARWSPSWGNAQAWSVTVVRGKALTNLT